MFYTSVEGFGNMQKLEFMVLKHFFLNRMLTKGYRKASLNYNFNSGDILVLNIIRLEKKYKSLQIKPTTQRCSWSRIVQGIIRRCIRIFILRNVYSGNTC
jgi:hypothetical protein